MPNPGKNESQQDFVSRCIKTVMDDGSAKSQKQAIAMCYNIAEWLELSKVPEGVDTYLNKYVFGVDNFEEYLELCGGIKKINYLKRREFLKEPMIAPWRKEA